jgi:hypothetical protein
MSETNTYSKGYDPVVGCSEYVAGVNPRKIQAMRNFNKYGKKGKPPVDIPKQKRLKHLNNVA